MIQGVTVKIAIKRKISEDSFGEPIYETDWTCVDNVLIGQPSSDDLQNSLEFNGKKIAYTLAIPKGDRHDWTDTEVILPPPFCGKFRTIGSPTYGIEANIPLSWNGKINVERYE